MVGPVWKWLRRGAVCLFAVGCAACATVPYTRRSQLVLLPESQEVALGTSAYRQILAREREVRDPRAVEIVRRVGERIAQAANRRDYRWEFRVIDDDSMINAFALPGGKVAVYTGLFPVAMDESGLAAVLGHEVAHAIARHAGERMSQGLLLQLGAVGMQAAMGGADPVTRDLVLQALGLGAQVGVILPFSRAQESEADHIGLILMAKAGYDPEAALHLWERMEKAGGKAPPEFLSTHPSYGTRQAQIRRWLPEARQYYKPVPGMKVAGLPSLSELEATEDHGQAAFQRYARAVDDGARSRWGENAMKAALVRALGIPPSELERRLLGGRFSLGEVAVASAIAASTGHSFEEVAEGYQRGQLWSELAGDDPAKVAAALDLLRATMVEARRAARRER